MGDNALKLTLVIPNRNRELPVVERSLKSLFYQNTAEIEVFLVDFGSDLSYQKDLRQLLKKFPKIKPIFCPVQGQLWNKSRAINIVLKQCRTAFFMVADMDMIYHPAFVSKILVMLDPEAVFYFSVGILTREETQKDLAFADYQIKFVTNLEATGMTLFPTQKLVEINGYDEFYHGWGSEDTDVHVRLGNAGTNVIFKNDELLFLHQWHPKTYRSKDATQAYHGTLERINARYLNLAKALGTIKVNNSVDGWGLLPHQKNYEELDDPDLIIELYHTQDDITALCFQLQNLRESCIYIKINHHPQKNTPKIRLKGILGRKTPLFCKPEESNERVLELLIGQFKNCPYRYSYDSIKEEITLKIYVPRR